MSNLILSDDFKSLKNNGRINAIVAIVSEDNHLLFQNGLGEVITLEELKELRGMIDATIKNGVEYV